MPAKPIIINPAITTICTSLTGGILLNISNVPATNQPIYTWHKLSNTSPQTDSIILNVTGSSYLAPPTFPYQNYFYVVASFTNNRTCINKSDNSNLITVSKRPEININNTNLSYCNNANAASIIPILNYEGSANLNYQWFKSNNNNKTNLYKVNGNAGTGNTLVPNTDTLGIKYYYVSVSAGANCADTSSTYQTITILNNPSANIIAGSNKSYCNNALVPNTDTIKANVSLGDGRAITSVEWLRSNSNNNPGNTVEGNTTNNINRYQYLPITSNIGSFYYYLRVSDALCSNISNSSNNIIVNPNPAIAVQPSTNNQNYCENAVSTSITVSVNLANGQSISSYKWYDSVINGVTTLVGLNAPLITPSTILSNKTIKQSRYYAIITDNNGCTTNSLNSGIISIYPTPVITGMPSTLNKFYCQLQNVPATDSLDVNGISVSNGVNISSYVWYKNATSSNIGGTAIQSSSTYKKLLPSTLISGDSSFYYLSVTDNNGCITISGVSGLIKTRRLPLITVLNNKDTSYCIGALSAVLNAQSTSIEPNTNIINYQWYSNNSQTRVNATTLNTGNTLVPLTNTVGTKYYYFIVTDNNTCTNTSGYSGAIITNSLPVINQQNNIKDTSYCKNVVSKPLVVNATGANLNYRWYSNSVKNKNGDLINNSNGNTYLPPTNNVGITYYYVVINDANNCSIQSDSIAKITINDLPTIATDFTDTLDHSYSLNDPRVITFSVVSNDAINNGYKWFKNSIKSYIGPNVEIINNQNTSQFTPKIDTASVGYYFVVASNNFGCTVTSKLSGKISVLEPPVITILTVNLFNNGKKYCINGIKDTLRISSTPGDGIAGQNTYLWYKSKTGLLADTVPLTNNRDSIIILPTNIIDTNYYGVMVTNTYNVKVFSGLSNRFIVYNNPLILVQNKFLTDTNYCKNSVAESLQIEVTKADIASSLTYNWQDSIVGNNAFLNINGVNTNLYQPTTNNIETSYYRVLVSESIRVVIVRVY